MNTFSKFAMSLRSAYPPHHLAANSDPIVLIHGFIGWGRDEMFGMKYGRRFFGSRDLQEVLESHGTETFTVGRPGQW